MKLLVLTNQTSGPENSDFTSLLKKMLGDTGTEYEIINISGKDITKVLGEINPDNYDIIAAAGGDGTINAVANKIKGTETALGVIPSGTFNHFAKDAGIPLGPEEAVENLIKGRPVYLDAGSVNGRLFLNNSSVGLYPRAVKLRDRLTQKLGGSKMLAMSLAFFNLVNKFPLFRFEVATEKGEITIKSPFVFIGNNLYEFNYYNFGGRDSLRQGELSVYASDIKTKGDMLRLAWFTIFGKRGEPNDMEVRLVKKVRILTEKKKIKIAIDGEITDMEAPLEYEIKPGSLKVILPFENEEDTS